MNLCWHDLRQHLRVRRAEPEIPPEELEVGLAGIGTKVGLYEIRGRRPVLHHVWFDIWITCDHEAWAGWQQYEIAFGQFDRIATVSAEMAFSRYYDTKTSSA